MMEHASNLCTREDVRKNIQKHGANPKCIGSLKLMCATSRNPCLKKPKMKRTGKNKSQRLCCSYLRDNKLLEQKCCLPTEFLV